MSMSHVGIIILIVLAYMVYDINRTPSNTSAESGAPAEKKKVKSSFRRFFDDCKEIGWITAPISIIMILFIVMVYAASRLPSSSNNYNKPTFDKQMVQMSSHEDIRPIENRR